MSDNSRTIKTEFGNLNQFERQIFSLLKEEKAIPLVLTFHHTILLPDVNSSPISELRGVFKKLKYGNQETIIYDTKVGSKTAFFLTTIPCAEVAQISIVDGFTYHNQVRISDIFSSAEQLEDSLFDLIRVNERVLLEFTFTEPVFIPYFSLSPERRFYIYASKQRLSKKNKPPYIWDDYVCLYNKEKAKTFYFTEVIPFQFCIDIQIAGMVKHDVLLRSSYKAGAKELKISVTEAALPADQFNLYELILKNGTRQRDTTHCIICGRELTRTETDYVHFLSNGNISNHAGRDNEDSHFGFFPIGPECQKQIPEEYVFTIDDIILANGL